MLKIKKALISVSDKTNLEVLAKKLIDLNVELIATQGTQNYLKDFGIPTTSIDSITKHPEAFQGRIKTLSFEISGALLHRRDDEQDLSEVKKWGLTTIDMVICNLYLFDENHHSVDNIDIGGPTLIRSSAKNYDGVTIVTSPEQYSSIVEELNQNQGHISKETRLDLAQKAFKMTSEYDQKISTFFSSGVMTRTELRYGENPHQKAYLEIDPSRPGLAHSQVVQGKSLSYNNYLDADAALKCCQDIDLAAAHSNQLSSHSESVVIIKHMNPCGAAVGTHQLQCLKDAWEGDPVSSFGSIVCFSRPLKAESAEWLDSKFIEVIMAPEINPEALSILSKKKNLRVLIYPENKQENVIPFNKRSISGGTLYQENDQGLDPNLQVVTDKPFPKELSPLAHFGIMITKNLTSNAISLVQKKGQNWQLIGAGMGQPNRIDSFGKLSYPRAFEKEHFNPNQAILISDAFFPFSDMIFKAKEFQIKYIIQPGGSIRDQEVISACNQNDISMIFTHRRHFKH